MYLMQTPRPAVRHSRLPPPPILAIFALLLAAAPPAITGNPPPPAPNPPASSAGPAPSSTGAAASPANSTNATAATTSPAAAPADQQDANTPAPNPDTDQDTNPPAGPPVPPAPATADHREHIATVTQTEDLRQMLTTADFWPRIAAYAAPPKQPATDPWTVPLLRYYFFAGGGLFTNLGHPALAMEHETLWPIGRGYLGKKADPKHYFVIGSDVHLDPILMPNEGLSDNYYPRRLGDWLIEFYLSSYLYGADVTAEVFPDTVENFSQRSLQLADYLLYSQYDINGDNAFSHDNFLPDYPGIEAQAQKQRWQYGFDDLFDQPWTDISGYQWSPHEPDLGVNAGSEALGLVRTWEVYRKQKYLDAARNFLLYQIPRHGFHTGLWRGRRYYWLSATPELPTTQDEDPVNSVEALVAAPLAAVGYYTHDAAMTELARGLLWYLCREWSTNGRWYYEGQENTAIQRDHPLLSQEGVCAAYSAQALPYLFAAGVDLDSETAILTPALHFLITHRPDSYPVENSDSRYVRSFLAFGQTRGLRPGKKMLLRTFIQITGGGFNQMTLTEKLPDTVLRPDQIDVAVTHGDDVTHTKVDVKPDGTFVAPIGAGPYKSWDMFQVDVSATLNSKFTVDEFPMDPPIVTVTPAPTAAPIPYTGGVQDYHFQTRLNANNFLDAPRLFYFPHNPIPVGR